jgi:indolepyruvate ferredoxin oxidoreductase
MATPALRDATLEDKYTRTQGPVLISGPQAIVRLMLLQRELDRRAGLNTAGYVSGYRGSPVGGIDLAMWEAQKQLDASQIVFAPGVNEDLAATAVWGTQQLRSMKENTVDGVFALWYGKGPGVDRAGDPLKHGNYAGTHAQGGVLAVFGDDHPGKSSTIAHHSEQAMAAHGMPILYPSNVNEFVEYGLLGYALSRYSGCWVAFKVVNETIEQTATVDIDLDALDFKRPPTGELPPEGVHWRGTFAPMVDEMLLKRTKLPLARRFARANGIDRVALGAPGAVFGLVTAGKAYQDTMQALATLGIDAARAQQLGIAVYKVGMIWPLEPEGLGEFAAGKHELMFIEEKNAFVESQSAAILYNLSTRPRITGKSDDSGQPLLPSDALLEPIDVALAIAQRLQACGIWDEALAERVSATRSYRGALLAVVSPGARRLPFYCSGCPHNTSTNFPQGSVAISGIGCHGMAVWAKPGTLLGTQMGGEGVNWVGLHRFTKTKHVFQNLGDGTYFHSGLLAIRQAIASGANITYKILFNDAVAMTGGQPVDGMVTPAMIAQQVAHEGVKRIVLVSDDPSRHGAGLPAGVAVLHRDEMDRIQRELREIPGCTVLIYEQTCASEKRRRRKRGEFADPPKRMFINEDVCEGCGDCSTQSGCVSIEPLETELGRKRTINQSNCNKDYSCVKGFCPSFVTVYDAPPKKRRAALDSDSVFDGLPVPAMAGGRGSDAAPCGVMIAGIGGTGVITVGAVLAMAAHLEGRAASAYDMTGLSQKNGAVYSHLKLADSSVALHSQRLGLGEASLVLAFDMVAALGDESYRAMGAHTRFLGNDRVQPTAALNFNPDDKVDTGLLVRKVREKLPAEQADWVDATGMALALMGDTIASNMLLVGVAAQKGWLPVSIAAIERAIELNGVQVPFNLRAFRLGRLWVHDRARVSAMLQEAGAMPAPSAPVAPLGLDALLADRRARLVAYQDEAYAQRFSDFMARVAQAERALGEAARDMPLSTAVARSLYKLMAYKDEYEVARLYSDPAFMKRIGAQFEGTPRLAFNLAPPLLARRDPVTGLLKKSEYGPWMLTAMRWAARLKWLRGGAFDVFGRTEERRMERALIGEYQSLVERLLTGLSAARLPAAVALAASVDQIRGYGHVKQASVEKVRLGWAQSLSQLQSEPAMNTTQIRRAA